MGQSTIAIAEDPELLQLASRSGCSGLFIGLESLLRENLESSGKAFSDVGRYEENIARLCDEAKEWGFATVCVNPRWVGFAADRLAGTKVRVCSVISFPLGTDTTKMKAGAAEDVIFDGAE